MKKIIFFAAGAAMIMFSARSVFAVDEDTYIRFTADSAITMHRLKGNPQAMDLWMEQMSARYPHYMDADWQSFADRLSKDRDLREKIYDKALENIKARGYHARRADRGDGITTIEITDY